MIGGVHRQHDGSLRTLAWDLGITVFDSSTANTDEMASLCFLEFTPGVHRIGCLEGWSSKESTKFLQLRIAWLIRGSQMDYCISTLQISAMSREGFSSSRQARGRFAWRGFTNDVLGDMEECTTWQ
jgi:hypothetical protein